MFDFFSKKRFLVDSLENFVDIHNHILPGIDDGAKNPQQSLALLRGFSDFGVTNFIATPHIMHNYYPNTPETIQASLSLLKNELLLQELRDIKVGAAAEYMVDSNFEAILESGAMMPLRKGYLLMEMSFLQAPINFDEAIVKAASSHYFPVLAHPERYSFLHSRMKKYRQYREQGILFQLNMLSLTDYYNKEVPKVAAKLLEAGYVDFIGSDVHNMEQLHALKNVSLPEPLLKKLIPVIQNTIETFY